MKASDINNHVVESLLQQMLGNVPQKGADVETPYREFAQAHTEKHVAMAAAYGSGGYTMRALAAYFGVH